MLRQYHSLLENLIKGDSLERFIKAMPYHAPQFIPDEDKGAYYVTVAHLKKLVKLVKDMEQSKAEKCKDQEEKGRI